LRYHFSVLNLQPTLSNCVVSVRPLTPGDWDALYAVASDPPLWANHPEPDRWQEPVFRLFFNQALDSGGALIAIDAGTGKVIGSSRYDLGRAGPKEIEIGWTFLARSHWGGRTNAALKRLMIQHALNEFDQVIFWIGENNIRSRRALEKIGGTLTDRLLEVQMATGLVRHVCYGIDRKSFEHGPLSDQAWAEIPRE
jgi:RimJ/RimL family protein N-acetyltransferase